MSPLATLLRHAAFENPVRDFEMIWAGFKVCLENALWRKGGNTYAEVGNYSISLLQSVLVCPLHNSMLLHLRAFKKLNPLFRKSFSDLNISVDPNKSLTWSSHFVHLMCTFCHSALSIFFSLSVYKVEAYEIYTLFIPFLFLPNIWESIAETKTLDP